jgi:tRNA pseudouridine55 synthase
LNNINTGTASGKPAKKEKVDVHGWLVLDKPVGMTSTHAVSIAKRLFRAKRAGHAGTLDPLASGLLPIAFGEATKTVPFVMEGRKRYVFTVRWGEERDTDDSEGSVTQRSDERPSAAAIRGVMSRFVGQIEQTPPRYSAIKVAGERAYDLARDGELVELAPRPAEVHWLDIASAPDAGHTVFTAECGKGTYVRALARDMGRALGCFGHVSALRRTAVGPFREEHARSLDAIETASAKEDSVPGEYLLPVEAGLAELPSLRVSSADAGRLARGQSVLLRGRDAPVLAGWAYIRSQGSVLALVEVEQGTIKPRRVFNIR